MHSSFRLTHRISLLLFVTALVLHGHYAFFLPRAFAHESENHVHYVDSPLNGMPIRSIEVSIKDIFESPSNVVYRWANDAKVNTRHAVIREELLFDVGDSYDEFTVRETERVLRRQRYLRDVHIVSQSDNNQVDIIIYAQDTWTLIPQLAFTSGDGRDRKLIGLSENNIAGYGKRVEMLYEEDDSRESLSGVVDLARIPGTSYEALGGYLDRTDGERYLLNFGSPFRSLLDTRGWSSGFDISDGVGRLFSAGDERAIFRQEFVDINYRYMFSTGNSEVRRSRFSVGYQYFEKKFNQVTAQDYEDLDLDPAVVTDTIVPEDRRLAGPFFAYEYIEPEYVSLNYIDRFERIEDYNVGFRFNIGALVAPTALGSSEDNLILTSNAGIGRRISASSFIRGEIGGASRIVDNGFENSLIRGELRYYNVFGPVFWGKTYLGKHTLAGNFFVDYGIDIDDEREFLLGADNALRGYDARTFSGDKRIALNLEERIHWKENVLDLISIGTAAFVEAGGASEDDFGRLISDGIYSDVGVGLRIGFPRSSGGKVLRLDFAVPLRDGPDGSEQFEIRLIASGGQLFSSFLQTERAGSERASVDVGFDR